MTGFYLALLATLLAGIGARDTIAVAQLAHAQGQRPAALAVALAICVATAGFAAWAASQVAPLLVPKARLVLAAMALALAGLESLVLVPGRQPREPTHSLFALALVLGAHQLTDAARFLVFAIAVATAAPVPAGMGGAVAGAAALALAWSMPGAVLHPGARRLRRAVGALLLAVGGYVALVAFGKL